MKTPQRTRPFVEKFEVAGDQLVAKLNELLQDINARRVVIKDQRGQELLSLPLNVTVVAGGLLSVASPVLAAVGALAALVARVHLEVERTDSPVPTATDQPTSTVGDVTETAEDIAAAEGTTTVGTSSTGSTSTGSTGGGSSGAGSTGAGSTGTAPTDSGGTKSEGTAAGATSGDGAEDPTANI